MQSPRARVWSSSQRLWRPRYSARIKKVLVALSPSVTSADLAVRAREQKADFGSGVLRIASESVVQMRFPLKEKEEENPRRNH